MRNNNTEPKQGDHDGHVNEQRRNNNDDDEEEWGVAAALPRWGKWGCHCVHVYVSEWGMRKSSII